MIFRQTILIFQGVVVVSLFVASYFFRLPKSFCGTCIQKIWGIWGQVLFQILPQMQYTTASFFLTNSPQQTVEHGHVVPILLVYPPTQDASHHQENYMFFGPGIPNQSHTFMYHWNPGTGVDPTYPFHQCRPS